MTETLYLDLLFLVNLFADLSLLLLTGLVLQIPLKKRKGRLLLGAAVGAGTSACRNASAWARALAAASSSALAIIC